MLYGNSMFNLVANAYMGNSQQSTLNQVRQKIQEYETKIQRRVKLQDIGRENPYISVLNNSLEYIEYADNMCSWTEQIMLTVKMKKDVIQKKYELEKIKTEKQVELLQEVLECNSKTEKIKLKEKKIKEALIDLEQELDEVKTHLDFCKIFVSDAQRTRELVYAYYQAVKNRGELVS